MLYNSILKAIYSQQSLNTALVAFYEKWKSRYLRTVQDAFPRQEYLFYTFDQPAENHAVTCSEAMGYGMCIFPMMSRFDPDAKGHFQALYRYVRSYPSYYNPNLMAWQQVETADHRIVNGSERTSSATDGDLDITYGLLLAHRLWGKTDASYLGDARLRMRALMTSCVSPDTFILLLGDWVLEYPQSPYRGVTRSSDFIPYIIRYFVELDLFNHQAWSKVLLRIHSIVEHQMRLQSRENGLMPDFFIKDGDQFIAPDGKVLESIHDGDYYYNSCRTPWRYAMESILYDTPVSGQLETLNAWARRETNGNPAFVMSGYYLAGGIPGTSFGMPGRLSFIAPFLPCALAQPGYDAWKAALWDFITGVPMTEGTFYDHTLRLLALIVATGHWLSP